MPQPSSIRAVEQHQHSMFDRKLQFVDSAMRCADGFYGVAARPGHGVTPRESLWQHIVPT